jgi:hypothetical protein
MPDGGIEKVTNPLAKSVSSSKLRESRFEGSKA